MPLKVLIVDDSEADAVLVVNELKDLGFDLFWKRVETPETMIESLQQKEWDIVITDYIMPEFSAMDAINIIKDKNVDVPIIVLTGLVNEEIAPELIKAGASDFISKNEMKKLAAAVEREVKRTVDTLEQRISQEEIKFSAINLDVSKKSKLTLKMRFLSVLVISSMLCALYMTYYYKRTFDEIEKTTRENAVNVSGIISGAVSIYAGQDKVMSPAVMEKTGIFLNRIGSELGYDTIIVNSDGIFLTGFEGLSYKLKKSGIRPDFAAVSNNGNSIFIKPKWENNETGRVLIKRINSLSGYSLGIMALDYSGIYSKMLVKKMTEVKIGLYATIAVLLICGLIIFYIFKAIMAPIKQIIRSTERIASGDLVSAMDIKRFDEMGELAMSFDKMREHLKLSMEKLKAEISDRHLAEQSLQALHLKLTKWVSELDKRTHEITLLNQMGMMLQTCKTIEEFHEVILRYTEQLFPEDHGAVYLYNESGKFLEAVCMWGKEPIEHSFTAEECWAIRSCHLYAANATENPNMLCQHIKARGMDKRLLQTICVPMMAQGETIGMFHIRSEQKPGVENKINIKRTFAREQLVGAVAEHITLTFSNLKLQDSLRQQSIHDPLTGMFNRRYMKDSLEREIYRAKRHNIPFGIIMLDIDFFKKFNDNYGHDVGDLVLERIGRVINNAIRPEDIACRYGGEEFLLILPGAKSEGTLQCANRILTESRALKIKNKGVMIGGITVSLGVASFPENGTSAEQVVKASDNALLNAKRTGRDCIVVSNEFVEAEKSF
jgi:diguanylate cyclase (GGDEF)-like protein